MLTFKLQDLKINVSQRADGSFRKAQDIECFFQNQNAAVGDNNFNLIHLQLENKNQLVTVDDKQLSNNQTQQIVVGDAIITKLKNGERGANKTLISMVVGDCFPLIFFDQKSQNMAMIHAGWQPLYLGILDKVWQSMLTEWDTEPEQVWAFLGPGIRADSYMVAKQPKQSQDAVWRKFISKHEQNGENNKSGLEKRAKAKEKTDLWQIDLPGFIKYFLSTKGLSIVQLIDSQLDTYALKEEFFSYRRSQEFLHLGEQEQAQSNNGRFFVACQL